MGSRRFALMLTVLLIAVVVAVLAWQSSLRGTGGKFCWAEIVIFPVDAEKDTQVPENLDNYLKLLGNSIESEAIGKRVARHFQDVLPMRDCLEAVDSIRLIRSGSGNRIEVRMATGNPLIGRLVLYEVLIRAKREFLEQTSEIGTEQSDLFQLKMKQRGFQQRIASVQRELDRLAADRTSPGSSKLKAEELSQQLEQLKEVDEAMKQQLETLEKVGEGMTFLNPTLELEFVHEPTYDQVSYTQLSQYDQLQGEHRELLEPLTMKMQKALINGTGFTVESIGE